MEDFELNDSDLQIDNEAINQARIDQLYREINQLRAQLNVPPGIQKAIGGMGIGYGLGLGSLGSVAMGFLGYQLGKGKELNDKQKQQIQAQIQLKARELLSMERGEQVEQAKISGVMSADELVEYKYDSYPFDGKWKNLIGNPAKSFHMMVFGRPKQGKSIFCFQLAKYLSKFGKVLYIASEEGFSATLQQKLQEFGAINPNLYFANYRDYETIKQNITGQDYEFIIIDSINFINLEPEDVEELKSLNKEKAFITIQQATKGGQFRGSQQFAHNCDIIIEVIQGVANHTGRYAAPSEMQIFDKPNFKTNKVTDTSSENQMQLFEDPV
jgi:predicted ATP-dependent serine protease